MKRYKRHQSGSAANERSGRVVKVKLNLLSLLALILAVSTALVWGPSLVHWAFGPKSAAVTLENTVQQVPGWRVGMLLRISDERDRPFRDRDRRFRQRDRSFRERDRADRKAGLALRMT
ncbi:hypothetical protein LGM60_32140, partial [Burkholderia vietnamiensis]|nr:hypothetical protein [Burkholderia vietnamiensis]